MKLNSLPKLKQNKAKRLGQGYGSGKGGHTSSRGQKGQKSRNSVRLTFTGSSWVWFKRLPFIRGKSRFTNLNSSYTLTLSDLDKLPASSQVNLELLRKLGFIAKSDGDRVVVRIVATGSLSKKLSVHLPASAAAVKAIEKAGGSCSVQTA